VRTELLDYPLPAELIATRPLRERDAARLLVLDCGRIEHRRVRDLPELLPRGGLLVLNDTRVRRARVLGKRRDSGGKVELLLLGARAPAAAGGEIWEALARSSKPLRDGHVVEAGSLTCRVLERREDGSVVLEISAARAVEQVLEEEGRVPIPPYLRRPDDEQDLERYQTVYSRRTGSVAAPTAGLHFTPELLAAIEQTGMELGWLELQIGLGTFRPVLCDDLAQHPMHEERFSVTPELAARVERARQAGRPVIALGTTVVRALESAADARRPGHVVPQNGSTRLMIEPGYAFRVIDALITNFHQPRSTLLALVAAFAGLDHTLEAYRVAMRERYRFLSFGDAMWLPRRGA
jgi:S-adenosylmethionine:tRNA ribosyltransferase-isomerase